MKVLFVCLGNICRSPMAEAIFRHKVKEAGLSHRISVDSAGTGDWHVGEPPHRGTRDMLKRKKIDQSGLRARQVRSNDFDQFDYVVAMDDSNLKHLKQLVGPKNKTRLIKMLDYHPDQHGHNVPDPYYTGNFDEVYELLDASCNQLLEEIKEQFGSEDDE